MRAFGSTGRASSDPGPDSAEEAEAIVVGSGFGGAVAACRLAQAGFDVVVIERGRRYEANDFPSLPAESALLPDLARWSWQASQGLWDIVNLEEVLSVQAAGYGGGSLVYANVHLRPPVSVFDGRWPEAYRGGAALEDFYDLASSMLDVAPIDAHEKLANLLIKPDQMRKLARHLGREEAFFHPPLAISFREGTNEHGRDQKRCTGCGACSTGCPNTAKNSLDFNYLAVAERRGARVVTQCEVMEIERRGDGGWFLTCFDHLAGVERFFAAGHLFLCAGSVHSTRLLARARLGASGRRAQSLIGVGYYPNADAVGMVYDTTHPQYPSFGPTITTSTACWDPEDRDRFFLIQDGGYARELDRLTGVLRAAVWLGRNRLTNTAEATVAPSGRPAPATPIARDGGLALASPVDDLLDAIAGGAFGEAGPAEIRRHWSALLGELRQLLLLPHIVGRTIDLSLAGWMKRFWLTSWLNPQWWISRLIARTGRRLMRWVVGDDEAVADRAFRAMLAGANLRRAEIAGRLLGYGRDRSEHRLMLLAMGLDAKPGQLIYDRQRDRLIADLDLHHLIPRYTDEERVMADMARALGGELRTNPAWSFLGMPVSVHSQGGCPMSDDFEDGVTTPDGQVHGCEGLYLLDGSILCTSVGVNPSATIMAIAERNILQFIRSRRHPQWPRAENGTEGEREYRLHMERAKSWAENARRRDWALRPPPAASAPIESEPLGLAFSEVMQGYYAATGHVPKSEEEHRRLETEGRPDFPIVLNLDVSADNLARLFEDCRHQLQLSGTATLRLPDEPAAEGYASYPVTGSLDLFVERRKPYGIRTDEVGRRRAQERLLGSRYTTVVDGSPPSERREMKYVLSFVDGLGREWALEGKKDVRDDPGPDAWRRTSSLFVSLLGPPGEHGKGAKPKLVPRGAGVVRVDLDGFLHHQLPSIRVTPPGVDPARAMWARMTFATFFFGTLQRIYLPGLRSAVETFFKVHPSNVRWGREGVGRSPSPDGVPAAVAGQAGHEWGIHEVR